MNSDMSMFDFLLDDDIKKDLGGDSLPTKTSLNTGQQYMDLFMDQLMTPKEQNAAMKLQNSFDSLADFVTTEDMNSPWDDILEPLSNEPSGTSSPPEPSSSIPIDIDFESVVSDPSTSDMNVSSPSGSEDSGVCSEVIETVKIEREPAKAEPEVIQINLDSNKNLLKKVYKVAATQPLVLPLSAIRGVKAFRVVNTSTAPTVTPITDTTTATTTIKTTSNKESKHAPLDLTVEEERLLRKEGLTLPSHFPLTKEEERDLKRIRRKIRNKISAQDSRKRKKEYLDGLEERMKRSDNENRILQQKVKQLENSNQSLMSQLRRLQTVMTNANHATHTSTTMLVLLLSFCLILLPNLRPGAKDNKLSQAQQFFASNSVPGRTLLSSAIMGDMSQKCDPSEMPVKEELEELSEQKPAVASLDIVSYDMPVKDEPEEAGEQVPAKALNNVGWQDHDYSDPHPPAKVRRVDNYTSEWVKSHESYPMDVDWGITEEKNDVILDGIWDTVPLAESEDKNKSSRVYAE